ncbi:MAG: hypothetical protein QOF02_1770 [Blastocatellia bacterium]|jgi:hypothetical protein|nr:hypothetical protein [Blastocatellia bacterium]
MSIEKFIEDQISKAMAEGEFDNLPGKGRPLDLNAYFQTPEDLRLCYSILKNGNFAPPEVDLLKEIESLKQQLASTGDEEQRQRLAKLITDKTLTFKMLVEKRQR